VGGFFSSLFGGQNKTLNSDMAQEGSLAGFSTGIGEKDTTAASQYQNDILSGDPTKESEALAPEISAAKKRSEEAKKARSENGNRGGGNNSANAAADAGVNSDILNMEGGLKSGAASALGSMGQSNLQNATSNLQSQEAMSQQQMENYANSILGKGITSATSSAESAGLDALGI
jgi:hypothetical protein